MEFIHKKSKTHQDLYYLGVKAWNILPQSLKASQSVKSFSSAYKNALMEKLNSDEHYQINNRFDEFYLNKIYPVTDPPDFPISNI